MPTDPIAAPGPPPIPGSTTRPENPQQLTADVDALWESVRAVQQQVAALQEQLATVQQQITAVQGQLAPLATHEHEYGLPAVRPMSMVNWGTVQNLSSGQDVTFYVMPFGTNYGPGTEGSQEFIDVPPGTTGPPKPSQ